EDVQVVGDLIRFNANEGGLRFVDRAVESLFVRFAELLWECRSKARKEMLPERLASTDQVLPQPRLGLMDARRGAVPKWGAVELFAYALLVHGVARLVHQTEKAHVEEVRRYARRDARVSRSE